MARIKRIREAETAVSPRGIIAAILTQSLPVDDERRTFSVLNAAYFALSLTDPALAIAPLVRNSNAVIDVIAAQLRAAQASGDTPAGLDPDLEAVSLLALAAGLGTSILAGLSSPEQAQAAIDYHLDRLFPASRPVLRLHVARVSCRSHRGRRDTGRARFSAVPGPLQRGWLDSAMPASRTGISGRCVPSARPAPQSLADGRHEGDSGATGA
jgi:hypothetical protein